MSEPAKPKMIDADCLRRQLVANAEHAESQAELFKQRGLISKVERWNGHRSGALLAIEELDRRVAANANERELLETALAASQAECELLRTRQRSDEEQLVRIAEFLGKDARQAPNSDASIAGLVKQEIAALRQQVEGLEAENERLNEKLQGVGCPANYLDAYEKLETALAASQAECDQLRERVYGDREVWSDSLTAGGPIAQAEADKHGLPVHVVCHGVRKYTAYPKREGELERDNAALRTDLAASQAECERLREENDRLRMACDIFEGNSADAADIQNTLIREMGVVGGTKELIRRLLADNAAPPPAGRGADGDCSGTPRTSSVWVLLGRSRGV